MDLKEIQTKLEQRKTMMRMAFISTVAIAYVGSLYLAFQRYIPEFVGVVIVLAVLVPHAWLKFVRCPRCDRNFISKTKQQYRAGERGSGKAGVTTSFQQVCVHCGLKLDGSNAHKPYEIGNQEAAREVSQLEADVKQIISFYGITLLCLIPVIPTWLFFKFSSEQEGLQQYPEIGYGLLSVSAIAVVYWLIKLPAYLKPVFYYLEKSNWRGL